MPVITVRPEVLEYGSVPIASWLPRLDNHAALQSLAHQLGQVAKRDESGRCEHLESETRNSSPGSSQYP